MSPASAEHSPGQFRLRDAVSLEGPVLFSCSPLSVTRLNEAARTVVDALDTQTFLDPPTVAGRVGMDTQPVASLLTQLQDRGFLDWKPGGDPEYTPLVSVVVTTLNSASDLGACLDALDGLAYPNYEVVLVDGGSTDRTVELARDHDLAADGRLQVVEPDPGEAPLSIGAGRNRGVAAAAGEVVAFTDADCRPREEWLADLVPCLAVHDVVGGRIRPAGDAPVDSYEGDHSSLDMGPRSARVDPDSNTPYLPTASLLARRAVVESVPFPDRNIAEDVAFCWGALDDGFDVVYHAGGVVEHAYEDQP
ncbi:MAG: cellulose synthase/poly-beta-1,6-N-acetylglucosamine synthase-like glycosyltransferase, partial [Haloarculaceae archaeon]